MSPTNHNSSLFTMLRQQLEAAGIHDDAVRAHNSQGTLIQVPGTGKAITSAYEQLRNAAEYTEDHLLLQRAIKRFFNRNFTFFSRRQGHLGNIGEELIVELTQAGYLHNNEFSSETAAKISHLADSYMRTYRDLRDSHVSREDASDWIFSLLSVEVEGILNPHSHHTALAYCAYQHYTELLPREQFATTVQESEEYDLSLYMAVHQALLKSDISTVRYDLMQMYHIKPDDLKAFIQFNRSVTKLYLSKFTGRLKRVVSKYGAPIRMLKSMVEERKDIPELIQDRQRFLDAFDHQVGKEYKQVHRRVNRGIIKSIIFIFITKVVIGVSIEVPYDLFVVGSLAYLPLAINLLFPPLYMASLKLGLTVPSLANAKSLHEYIDTVLYGDSLPIIPSRRDIIRSASTLAKLLYTILFFIPFAITVYVLHLLNFNIVQAAIFFAFLSTASFFGFRLSSMIRELEIVTHQSSMLSTLRDFFYLPFILVGQWLSSKYAKINAVAYFLDIAIELPLKTVLRLIRQWTRFLNEKHEEIY
jgi:hypothetical protein